MSVRQGALDNAVPTSLRRPTRNTDSSNECLTGYALGGSPSLDERNFERADCAETWADYDIVSLNVNWWRARNLPLHKPLATFDGTSTVNGMRARDIQDFWFSKTESVKVSKGSPHLVCG